MRRKLLYFALYAAAFAWFGKDGQAQNPPVNATQLRGRNISTTAPTNGQVYEWDTATLTWKPATPSGGASPAGSAGCVQLYGTSTTFACAPFTRDPTTGRITQSLAIASDVSGAGNSVYSLFSNVTNSTIQSSYQDFYAGEFEITDSTSGRTNTDIYGQRVIAKLTGTGDYRSDGNGITGSVVAVQVLSSVQAAYAENVSYNIYTAGTSQITNIYGVNGNITVDETSTVSIIYGDQVAINIISPNVTTAYAFYASTVVGAVNSYSFWSDEQGVFRIKTDNTFNSVYQAIPALYNPQFTKYTPGAANYERIVLGQWESNVAVITTEKGGTGTLRGLRIGDASVPLFLGSVVSGAATGKRVLCIDDSTKQVFESSTGTDCSN